MAGEWNSGSDELVTTLTTHVDNRSYSAWVYREGDGGVGVGRVWEKTDATDDSFFNASALNAYIYRRDFDSSNGEWYFTRPSINEWHQIGVTYNDTSTSNDPVMYLDGVAQSITEYSTPSGTPIDNASGYSIGNRIGALDVSWDGYIAEVAFWDRILTAGEMAALGKGASPLFFPNDLVLYYPLIRDFTLDLVGSPGTAADITVVAHPKIFYPSRNLISFPSVDVENPTLVVADAASAVSLDAPTLVYNPVLTVADAASAVSLDNVTIGTAYDLIVADATSSNTIDSPTLYPDSIIVQDLASGSELDNIDFSTANVFWSLASPTAASFSESTPTGNSWDLETPESTDWD